MKRRVVVTGLGAITPVGNDVATTWRALVEDNPFPAIAPIKPRTTAELNLANPRVSGHGYSNETAYAEQWHLGIDRRLFGAMALELTGGATPTLVDPHGGAADLMQRVLRTPLGPEISFVAPGDLWRYFLLVPDCSPEWWGLLRAGVLEFWGQRSLVHSGLPPVHRLAGWLVERATQGDHAIRAREGFLIVSTDDAVAAPDAQRAPSRFALNAFTRATCLSSTSA